MTGVVVFIGPSLGVKEAGAFAPFDYRPPAAQGDIQQAVADGARVVGLVDGYFEGVPAVRHKEILHALSSGVHVFGAASMGAIRAAELDSFGMRGIGRIYEWYRDGLIEADDEVALVHGPSEAGFVALSEPLVNIRATLDKAVSGRTLAPELAGNLLQIAARLFYKERTWERVLAVADLRAPVCDQITDWLGANRIDQKQLDSRALVESVSSFIDSRPGPFRAGFIFEPTDAWNLGLNDIHREAELSEVDIRVLDEARLRPARFKHLMQAAALALLAGQPDPAPERRAPHLLDRFRIDRGLVESGGFRQWQAANATSESELSDILAVRAQATTRAADLGETLLQEILNEIKLRGLHKILAERAERKARVLSHAGRRPTGSSPLPLHLLLEWFFVQRLGQTIPDDLDATCREFALPDRSALQELLAREFAFDSVKG